MTTPNLTATAPGTNGDDVEIDLDTLSLRSRPKRVLIESHATDANQARVNLPRIAEFRAWLAQLVEEATDIAGRFPVHPPAKQAWSRDGFEKTADALELLKLDLANAERALREIAGGS